MYTDKDGIQMSVWNVLLAVVFIVGVVVVWSAGWIILQELGEWLF